MSSGTPDVALLNTFDLVIISRSVPSGDYQDPPETAAWNGLTAPTMIMGGYVLFLSGSREASTLTSQGAGIYDLTADGAKLFLNAVAYMTSPPTTSPSLSIQRDGANVTLSWQPAGGALETSANLVDWTPVPGATSPATIAIGPANAFYRVEQ